MKSSAKYTFIINIIESKSNLFYCRNVNNKIERFDLDSIILIMSDNQPISIFKTKYTLKKLLSARSLTLLVFRCAGSVCGRGQCRRDVSDATAVIFSDQYL